MKAPDLIPDILDAEVTPSRNRAQRRAEAKSETRFRSRLRRNGRWLQWRPTQVPEPARIARRRRRNKIARASRKANR